MSDEVAREFPAWKSFYDQVEVEAMPWYHPELDQDLAQALTTFGPEGGKGLDLGTGPGTQALQLARLGYTMTGSDLSATAISKAADLASSQGLELEWRVDDVLASGLQGPFDFIFDRGCFHVLAPADRPVYVATVARLLAPAGRLFLKCFSRLQPSEVGPYRFRPDQIHEIFSPSFEVRSIHETVYQGTLDSLPKALFCVLQRA